MADTIFSEVLRVITQINKFQKRFREAKGKHKDDLEELKIITEVNKTKSNIIFHLAILIVAIPGCRLRNSMC